MKGGQAWKIAVIADTETAAWNAVAVIPVHPIGKKVVRMNQIELININRRKIDVIDIRRVEPLQEDDAAENRSARLTMMVSIATVMLMIAGYIIFGY